MDMRNFYTRKTIGFIIVCGLVLAWYAASSLDDSVSDESPATPGSHLEATYEINGEQVELSEGYSEVQISPDSAATVVTRFFGNELFTDLDGDGDEDVAFILSQETGGSGVFYYAVAALQADSGYQGSDGYFLGDRIAPQSTDESPNPRHKNVVVFNYADRFAGEPMTTPPSIGKSVYLKIVPDSLRWAIVEPDFEGESAY